MYYYEVAPTKVFRSDSNFLTYEYDGDLKPGQVVLVEVGKSKVIAIVIKPTARPEYKTKSISEILGGVIIPKQLLKLSLWMCDYYSTPLAQVLQTVLPRGIGKKRRGAYLALSSSVRDRTNIVFNASQQDALKQIAETPGGSIILHGVTGSGKTAVYIESAKQAIEAGKSAVVIIPEIALSTQIVDEFSMHFDDILVTHSKQTEAERHIVWNEALLSSRPRIVIGPRSALFTPLSEVGLIVIDEFHEPSLKQEQAPRYSAQRVASILATEHGAKVILGSATPPVAEYYIARSTGKSIIHLPEKARDTTPASIALVDMTKREEFKKHKFISDKLLAAIDDTIARHEQVLIFHNRRGSTSVTLCQNCGWQATCPRCFVPLALHSDKHSLNCHICGFKDKVPTSCPVCGGVEIIHKGVGTKLIESELRRLYPKATIRRFDGDSATDETLEKSYKSLYDGNIDIIIGTQIVAKGLDLPKLSTVGVVQADAGLSLPDFISAERTFQLLAQVAGRVGRDKRRTSLVIQAFHPDSDAVVDGLNQDYADFYTKTLTERKRANFPPFTYLLKLTCVYKTEAAAIRNAQKLARELRSIAPKNVEILGPTPAFYERQRDTYRWQLVVKSSKRSALQELLRHVPQSHWQYELDPLSLL